MLLNIHFLIPASQPAAENFAPSLSSPKVGPKRRRSLSMAYSSSHFSLLVPHLPKLSRSLSVRSSSSPIIPPASTPSFDLQSYWTTLLTQINAYLDTAIPVRYPETIFRSMRHSVLAPGAKRAPPVMCIASCELLGGPHLRPAAFPTAAALEMVHVASLVHDDLPSFDAAPSRRGFPSNHSIFGVDMAVLAGDALFPLALHHIASASPPELVDPSTILQVIREVSRAVGATGMAAGQYLDLGNEAVDAESVMLVMEKKFGEMAECSAVCGGLLGGATEEEVERLRRYGRAVGVLYQVVDDVLMEERGMGPNGDGPAKMRSNASVVRAMGMDRALKVVEELRGKAKKELEEFGEKYGERVMPLYSFVDYAVERGFTVETGAVCV